MPEEVNRIVADHISDLLLAPTWTAMKNLAAENLAERAVRVGDVMRDAVLHNRGLAEQRSQILSRLDLEPRQYGVVTIHRAENTVPDRLGLLVDALNRVAQDCLPLVFPVHPRARSLIGERAEEGSSRLRLVEPLGYLDMLRLTGGAALALTDSGGLQKEAMFLDCPCITLRRETEWPETVKCGANRLVRGDGEAILRAVEDVLSERSGGRQDFSAAVTRHFGDGHAADRIVEELVHFASS
jgi:UDP-GlcNAc3NAcA epimerase